MEEEEMTVPGDLVGEQREREKQERERGIEAGKKENARGLVLRRSQIPPNDDCCPICFGAFKVPSKTSCGHWFCANCILTFWNFTDPLSRCKCPICSRLISKLTPEASAVRESEEEVVEALKKVQRYNRLFAGGALGLMMKTHQLPLFFERFLIGLFDPSKIKQNYAAARFLSLLMTLLYTYCGFGDFWGAKMEFDCIALTCMGIPAILGIFHLIINQTFGRRLAIPHVHVHL